VLKTVAKDLPFVPAKVEADELDTPAGRRGRKPPGRRRLGTASHVIPHAPGVDAMTSCARIRT
jgi:hypothetical protein